MKRGFNKYLIVPILIVFLTCFVSSEIVFQEPLNSVYNLGDIISIPVTVKDVSGNLNMNLVCDDEVIPFYTNWALEGEDYLASLFLTEDRIGKAPKTCIIKVILDNKSSSTDEFKISDVLVIELNIDKEAFDAGEDISVSGKVLRENGENSNGSIKFVLKDREGKEILSKSEAVEDGDFEISIPIDSKTKAGVYFLEAYAYEKYENGEKSNSGYADYSFWVNQVPTELKLTFEAEEINPGDSLRVKGSLYDQTGDTITSTVVFTITGVNDTFIYTEEVNTEEFFEYSIADQELPTEWKVSANSKGLEEDQDITIKEKEYVDLEILNETILITNKGNVYYNKSVLVQIGETPFTINVSLGINESKKYFLTAPDGEYEVKVIAGEDNEINQKLSLTGYAVNVKDSASNSSFTLFLWALIIISLIVVVLALLRRLHKKPSFARNRKPKNEKKTFLMPKSAASKDVPLPLINQIKTSSNPFESSTNKAEISLSIKGQEQVASIVCLKVQSLNELTSSKSSSTYETIQKIKSIAGENKGVIYQNQDYLMVIFSPLKTKTMKNNQLALSISQRIQSLLLEHNRKFNQKLEFGISLNEGVIIAKIEDGIFKFMGMGSLITLSKKIASLSKQEVLISQETSDSLRTVCKCDKETRDGTVVFVLKDIKKEDEEANKFIQRFLTRQKE